MNGEVIVLIKIVSDAMAKPMLAVKLLIKSNTGITINLFNGLTNA